MTPLKAARKIAPRGLENGPTALNFLRAQHLERLRAQDLIDQNGSVAALSDQVTRRYGRLQEAVGHA